MFIIAHNTVYVCIKTHCIWSKFLFRAAKNKLLGNECYSFRIQDQYELPLSEDSETRMWKPGNMWGWFTQCTTPALRLQTWHDMMLMCSWNMYISFIKLHNSRRIQNRVLDSACSFNGLGDVDKAHGHIQSICTYD